MIDLVTKQPLSVSDEGSGGPYIDVPEVQLEELLRVLDQHQIPYCVDEDIMSIDDGPEMATVNLGRGVNAASVQAVLDSVN